MSESYKNRPIRNRIADWLSFLAVKLRGQKWYVNKDCWAGMPGNRAAELRQTIWERCVIMEHCVEHKDILWLEDIEAHLMELGQLAGENWGHIMPKEEIAK